MNFNIALTIKLLLPVLCLCSQLTAQEINLSGTVLDIKSGAPLQGVEVSLAAHQLKDTTDEQGKFTIVRAATRRSDRTGEPGAAERLSTATLLICALARSKSSDSSN